jgi:hypothetical protein
LFDAGKPAGADANLAKLLAADASWEAANVCLQTFGGFGFAADYDVERKFRETRLYQVAPISHKPDPVVHWRARARDAEIVLMVKMQNAKFKMQTRTRASALVGILHFAF